MSASALSRTGGARSARPLERVAVALDTADWSEFSDWCRFFGPRVGVLKVGLQAYVEWGRSAVDEALRHGSSIFLDLKLHDIPNTVAGAAGAARSLGVDLLTVHASGGRRMLEAAAEAAGNTRVIAVTVLTHLAEDDLAELDFPGSSEERARRFAELAYGSGCAGVVCSPLELHSLRASCPEPFRLITPGIRPRSGASSDDQRRVSTPRDALDAGSDLLVIGRPLTRADDREKALERLESELSEPEVDSV